MWVIDGIATAFAFIYYNAIGIKHRLISVNIISDLTLDYSLKHILKNLHLMYCDYKKLLL